MSFGVVDMSLPCFTPLFTSQMMLQTTFTFVRQETAHALVPVYFLSCCTCLHIWYKTGLIISVSELNYIEVTLFFSSL